jgi:hypothetical protein
MTQLNILKILNQYNSKNTRLIILAFAFWGLFSTIALGATRNLPISQKDFSSIHGTITSIDIAFSPKMQEKGLHLTLKNKSSSIEYTVHVCPDWYAEQKRLTSKFQEGDFISVSGWLFKTGKERKPNLYAATIDSLNLRLRDANGVGVWKRRNAPDPHQVRRPAGTDNDNEKKTGSHIAFNPC